MYFKMDRILLGPLPKINEVITISLQYTISLSSVSAQSQLSVTSLQDFHLISVSACRMIFLFDIGLEASTMYIVKLHL